MPYEQHPGASTGMHILVRTAMAVGSMSQVLQRKVHERSAEVPVRFTTMEAFLSKNVAAPRFRTLLLGIFARRSSRADREPARVSAVETLARRGVSYRRGTEPCVHCARRCCGPSSAARKRYFHRMLGMVDCIADLTNSPLTVLLPDCPSHQRTLVRDQLSSNRYVSGN